jgi:hypothetical protein
MRGEARIRAARAAADPAAKSAALAAAREDFARAVSLASLDPRVQAEARLRASRAALAGGDAPTAVRDAEEALRLREAANRDARSSLFVNDYYLRSPLAEYHARLAEAYAAAGRTSDAERERGKAAALR